MAANLDLQDEVERILRKLSLEDIKAVATHLQIGDLDAVDNARTVLRSVQDQFDNAANADARDLLLRGLPIPDAHNANYQRLLEPDQVVPNEANMNNNNNGEGGGQGQLNEIAPLGGVDLVGQVGQVGNPPANQQFNFQQLGNNVRPNLPINVLQNGPQQNNLQQNFGGILGGGLRPQIGGGLPQQHPWLGGVRPGNSVGIHQNGVTNRGSVQPFGVQNYANYAGQQQQQQNVNGGLFSVSNQGLQQNAQMPAHDVSGLNNGGLLNGGNQGLQQNAQMPARDAPGLNDAHHGAAFAQINNGGNIPAQNAQLHPAIVFPQQNQPQQRLVQMFPREFRMTGSVSDDIEKSNEYLDICRQVADGRRKGYSDVEIMSGLRRIIAPGAVKTYVDSQMDLPLEDVLFFLRSFLKVRSPAELNNELSQLAQVEGQAAIKFFMDAIKLRQLLIVGSQLEGYVSYDPKLVHSTFLHTIRTGLRDEAVRTYMLPFLAETSQIDDNRLIQELHKAVAEAEERKTKTKKGDKTAAKVNVVESSPELTAVMKKLEENENQMRAMQEQMKELLTANSKRQNSSWKKNAGCQPCKDSNKASSCRHCWKCGHDGHKSQDCPN